MLATVTSVTGLANVHQKLWDSFNSSEIDDDTIDLPEFRKISAIEAKIAKASFKTRADKLAGVRGDIWPTSWASNHRLRSRLLIHFSPGELLVERILSRAYSTVLDLEIGKSHLPI